MSWSRQFGNRPGEEHAPAGRASMQADWVQSGPVRPSRCAGDGSRGTGGRGDARVICRAFDGMPSGLAAGEHSRPLRTRRSCPGAKLALYPGRMLAVLCLCLSAARCSTPGHATQWGKGPGGPEAGPSGLQVERILKCLTRYRAIPGGVSSRSRAESAAGNSQSSAAGCMGTEVDPSTLALRAGDRLELSPAENVEWRMGEGLQDGIEHATGADFSSVRSAAHQHMRTGRGSADEMLTFTLTRSGAYHILLKPQNPASLNPPNQLRVMVSSGYPSPRTSKACYIAPPTSNDTEADLSSERQCKMLNSTLTVSFDTTSPVSEYLSNKIVADYEAMNISNVSVAQLLADRELPECISRKCLTLQVRRYDSWKNPVLSTEMVSEISVEIQGVDTSMFEEVKRGIATVVSDRMPKKWETYQWIGRGGKSKLGNTTCNQFACNATKLVGPETQVIAWVVVRMDGVPLGQGSPFEVRVTGGGFHSFLVDPASMRGQIQAAGGAAIRLIPMDRAGNPLTGVFSHNGNCDPRSSCGRFTDTIEKAGIKIIAECFLNGALTQTRYELNVAKTIGRFRPDTTCTQRGCGSLVEFWYCNPRFDLACGATGTKTTSNGNAYEVSSFANERPECMSCPFVNGEAMIAPVQSNVAFSCILNLTFNGTVIQNPIRTQNTIATDFFGMSLMEGQSILSLAAGEPNATLSTVRYPWANETAKEFKGAIGPKGAFELIVTLQDSYSNPSGGLVGVVAELKHPEMILKLDNAKFNATTGGFHVIGHVTVSGQYRLQLTLEPFLVPLGGSPFLVDITAGEPVIPHTLLIKHPETVTIDAFGQFFFQPRDLYFNFVTSFHSYFDPKNYVGASPNNKASGFWIWVVPRNIKDKDTGQTLEPTLDKSGFNILRCGDDPDPCQGDDPGLSAFVAAFRPEYVGEYYLELQYCDPRTHVSGVQCDDAPQAYNHTSMKPPQAPNPCRILPAGKGGARTGLACTLDAMGFTVGICISFLLQCYACGSKLSLIKH